MANNRQTKREKGWSQLVDEVDPDRRQRKEPAYTFSNLRTFSRKRKPYGG